MKANRWVSLIRLRLSKHFIEGLQQRDRIVFEHARRRGIPVASTMAGGYARRVADTVRIHVNTIVAARDVVLQQSSAGGQ